MNKASTLILTIGLVAVIAKSFAQTPPAIVPFPHGPIPVGLGVCVHHLDESPKALRMMYDTGFRYVRTDLKWNEVETSPGVYDFSSYDVFMGNATAAGLNIMFILDYKNPLYDGGYSPYTEAGDTAFANYAKASVAHFQGKGVIWEMYNEPTGFWTSPGHLKLKADSDADIVAPPYAAMANKAGKAIKDTFPNEIIIGPALPWSDSKSPANFQNTMSFFRQTLQAGAGNYWDAVSDHPYRMVAPEWAFPDMAILRNIIAAYSPHRALPLVDSEWGYSSAYWSKSAGGPTYDQAEIQKAQRLARAIIVDRMQGTQLTTVYDWMDDGTDHNDLEHNFGLVKNYNPSDLDPAITPLPAFRAIKTLTTVLDGYTYSSRVDTGDPTDYIVQFVNGPRTVWACWNRDGLSHQRTVPLGSFVSTTKTNYDGSSVTARTSGANGFNCTTSEAAQYFAVDVHQSRRNSGRKVTSKTDGATASPQSH